MSTAIERMLESYEVETIYDQKNAMKEIMQEIVLWGLSRAGFFKKAAFYSGTAASVELRAGGFFLLVRKSPSAVERTFCAD